MKLCMNCMEYYEDIMDLCPHCGCEEERKTDPIHLTQGTILRGRYIIGQAIAAQEDHVVYIARDKLLKRRIAVREYLPGVYATRREGRNDVTVSGYGDAPARFREGMELFLEEGRLAFECREIEGIVHVYETFHANHTAYVVTEYFDGENLSSFLEHSGRVSEEDAMEIMMPILKALEALQDKGIIFGNIDPDSIYLAIGNDGRVVAKLRNLGRNYCTLKTVGTENADIHPGYSAPETYVSDPVDSEVMPDGSSLTGAADVYSVAAVLYRMVTGVIPPDAMIRRARCQQRRKDPLVQPIVFNSGISASMEIALMNALNLDVPERTESADRFLEELVSLQPVQRRGGKVHTFFYMRWPRWAQISVPILTVLGALLLFIAITTVFSKPQDAYVLPDNMVRVPDFVGADLIEAQQWAEERGLQLVSSGSEYVPKTAEGLILTQSESMGRIVEKGTTVEVTIAVAKEYYSMPDVTGMSLELASPILKAMGVEIRTVIGEERGYHEGCIISQDIAAFTEVSKGDVVTLTLAGETVTHMAVAPKLTEMSLAEALEAAKAAGVLVRVSAREFGDYADNTVLTQSIAPGEEVRGTNSVKLTVGMQTRSFRIPNLVYRTQYAVGKILGSMGIVPVYMEEKSEVVAFNHIIDQSAIGRYVRSGDSLTLTISAGGRTFAMPTVLEMTPEEAQETLEALGLKVKFDYGFRKSVEEGCIMAQSAEPEDEVCKGMEILLTICSRDTLDPLLDVTGNTKETAKEIMHGQGMLIRYEYAYDDQMPEGHVISQTPEAGSKNPERTVITLVVSRGPEIVATTEAETVPRETRAPHPTAAPTTAETAGEGPGNDPADTDPAATSPAESTGPADTSPADTAPAQIPNEEEKPTTADLDPATKLPEEGQAGNE